MRQGLRIVVSSPGDVEVGRWIAAPTVLDLANDYTRFFKQTIQVSADEGLSELIGPGERVS